MGDSYRDLIAWRKGISLVARIYESTREFPRDKLYGLSHYMDYRKNAPCPAPVAAFGEDSVTTICAEMT
jgi:23S rRNA-intervening sequence protein